VPGAGLDRPGDDRCHDGDRASSDLAGHQRWRLMGRRSILLFAPSPPEGVDSQSLPNAFPKVAVPERL
jgi:hypothetical protein